MTEQLYEYEKNVFLRCPECFDEDTIKKVLSHKMMENAIIEEYKDNPLVKVCVNNTLHENYRQYGLDDKYGIYRIVRIKYLDGTEESECKESVRNIISDISFSQIPETKERCYFRVWYRYLRYEHERKVDVETFLDMCYKAKNAIFTKESCFGDECRRIEDIIDRLDIKFDNSFSKEDKKRIKNYLDCDLPVTKEELENSIKSGIVPPCIKSEIKNNIGLTPTKIKQRDNSLYKSYIDDCRKNNPIIFVPEDKTFTQKFGHEKKTVYFFLGYDLYKYIECIIKNDSELFSYRYTLSYHVNQLIAEYLECRLRRKYHKDKFRLKDLLRCVPDQHLILSKIIIKYNEYIIKENGKKIDKQSRSKRVI